MKFTTWQLVVILGILVAGIVCANVFAPGAAATIVSIATTLVGTLFVTHDNGPKDPPAGTGGPPALTLVSGVLACLMLAGCGAALGDLAQNPNADALSKCRGDARAAFYVNGKTEAEALAVYDACVAKIPTGAK